MCSLNQEKAYQDVIITSLKVFSKHGEKLHNNCFKKFDISREIFRKIALYTPKNKIKVKYTVWTSTRVVCTHKSISKTEIKNRLFQCINIVLFQTREKCVERKFNIWSYKTIHWRNLKKYSMLQMLLVQYCRNSKRQ